MLRIVFLSLLVVGSLALSRKFPSDGDWESFKSAFHKVYTPNEEAYRRLIFEQNRAYIKRHNAEAKEGKHTFTLGINIYADMTNAEFVKQMNGYRQELKTPSKDVYMRPNNVSDLPTTVDWRTEGYVTGVKNQQKCGSCWAFSATGSLEGQHFKKNGTLVSLSEQNLVDCSRNGGNFGCGGGLMDAAFEFIRQNRGIDTELSYPYQGKDEKCRFNRENVGATDVGFVDIRHGNESDLQSAVATVGPISVAINTLPSFQHYRDGVYNEPICSRIFINHAVLVVGYGVYNGTDYWMVKNSYGLSWGMEGYIMMSRNKNNQCGIATAASYPRV